MEAETGYHATMNCTRARDLRKGLADLWNLPHDKELAFTGRDWVLVFLDKLNQDTRDKLMFVRWKAWHDRNNIIFGDDKVSVQIPLVSCIII
jgi:hypothetical protein